MRRRVAALDRAAARRAAASGSWPSEHVLPGLSRLAGHGFLWMVLAAALWATGRRQARRAAWRGLGSMAAASTAANVVGATAKPSRRTSAWWATGRSSTPRAPACMWIW